MDNLPPASKEKSPNKESSTNKKSQKENELENFSEDEIVSLVQKCFSEIAEKMLAKGLTPKTLFKDKIYTKVIDGVKQELISPNDFNQLINKIGVRDLETLERNCINKMLAASETEEGFKVGDLIQILEDYGNEENPDKDQDDKDEELNFKDLNKTSMVLLLVLSEYTANSNIPLEKIFESVIYKQPVQIEDEELEIDILNSSGFFKIINDLGIETEPNQHDNLNNFLCIDQSYQNKFSLDKLNMAIEEFKTNDNLRETAKQYYQEFIDEGQVQDDNEE